jgi:hypothetical protein
MNGEESILPIKTVERFFGKGPLKPVSISICLSTHRFTLARALHRRCVALREKLACELAISKRLSLAGTRVTAGLQAERRKSQRLLRSSERKK